MPTPKHMLWIVALSAGTYVVLKKYETQKGGFAPKSSRYGA